MGVPGQIIQGGHAEAGHHRALPLLGKQLLPNTLLGAKWLFHLSGAETVTAGTRCVSSSAAYD